MTRYRFYIGTRDRDRVKVSHDRVRDYLVMTFGGYSASTVDGTWRDDMGKIIAETSVVYEVLGQPKGTGDDHATTLRRLAKQCSVLWTAEGVEGGFSV